MSNNHNNNPIDDSMVTLDFIGPDQELLKQVRVNVGSSILAVTRENELPLEGACDGSLACSTCHVIFDKVTYSKLPKAKDEEEDMLDLAFGLEATSRLGCQVIVEKNMEGAKITIPTASRNFCCKNH